MKLLRHLVILLFMLGLSIPAIQAQDDFSSSTVTFQIREMGNNIPESLVGGRTTITFENETNSPYIPVFARLNDDTSPDQFSNTVENEGIDASLPLITFMGAPALTPGTHATAQYNLDDGTYVFGNLANPSPEFSFINVATNEGNDLTETRAGYTIELHDFAFSAPIEVESGEKTWLLKNHGEQWHEVRIDKLDETMTLSAFHDIVQANVQQPQMIPRNLVTGRFWTPMSAGQEAYLSLDLEPGIYALSCYVPNVQGAGEPHAAHGMVQLIEVTEPDS